jgi:hypothetical protein
MSNKAGDLIGILDIYFKYHFSHCNNIATFSRC